MIKTKAFAERIGAVRLPEAEMIVPEPEVGLTPDPEGSLPPFPDPLIPSPFPWLPEFEFKWPPPWPNFCLTKLRQGCYTVSFRPKIASFFGPTYRGTLRVEHVNPGYRFSSDLYRRWLLVKFPDTLVLRRTSRQLQAEFDSDDAADTGGVIPIYTRKHYHSYLKGTAAVLRTVKKPPCPCYFTLSFDEFRYAHPTSGFSGSFPTTADRSIRWVLNHTTTPHFYSGTAFEGTTELGSVSIRWVSQYFRRATLEIHTLEGAETPPEVTSGAVTENFRSIFATTNWDLTEVDGGQIPLQAGLVGVQNPDDCWTKPNSATLMESVPGYDPGELDRVWKARLIAVPAELGCSRGRMFDNGTGDPNDVAREGAVTHSHDGYPAPNANFGAAEGGLQKDFPRAFLRSAAHEVGHTFNQIHQSFEGGNDNSIMTVTPSVAAVLAADGLTFPDDINLGVNDTVRRHLAHLPDPAVRPGAMDFFGAAISAPEADQVAWHDNLLLKIKLDSDTPRLGQPVEVSWTMKNHGDDPVVVPDKLDVESLTVRVSVTNPQGTVTFMRPLDQEVCTGVGFRRLDQGESSEGETLVFWGRDGFAFESPGRHCIEVIVLWQFNGVHFGTSAETTVWVAHPVNDDDNRIAALLIHPDVGRAVAAKDTLAWGKAESRMKEALKVKKTHPACAKLQKLGLLSKK